MTVGDVIEYCDNTNCKIVDALGDVYSEVTKDNRDELVEHISAYNGTIWIWTFRNIDKPV